MKEKQLTRRKFIKKAAYVAPVILTLPAILSYSSAGSGNEDGSKAASQRGRGGGGGMSCNRRR